MGIHPAPSFANIYLAKRIDNELTRLASKYDKNGESAMQIFKRFLDDLIKIFVGNSTSFSYTYNVVSHISDVTLTLHG